MSEETLLEAPVLRQQHEPQIIALLQTPAIFKAGAEIMGTAADRTGITLVSTLAHAEAFIDTDTECLLLIEIDNPADASTAKALDWLSAHHDVCPHHQSIVLSKHCDAETVVSSLVAGASGYLVNDPAESAKALIDTLFVGLNQLAGGTPPVSDAVMPHLVQAVRSRTLPPVSSEPAALDPVTPLSRRETEVLNLAAKGFSCAEMAAMLELSVHTISSHTRHIYTKLEVKSRSAAIYEATRLGLLLERSAA